MSIAGTVLNLLVFFRLNYGYQEKARLTAEDNLLMVWSWHENMLWDNLRTTRLLRLLMLEGISPTIEFWSMASNWRCGRLPIFSGSVPLIRLFPRSNLCRLDERLPTDISRLPLSLFLCINSIFRLGQLAREAMNCQLSDCRMLLCRSSRSKPCKDPRSGTGPAREL